VKIIHAADLHLDSPLRGLERYEGAPVEALRGATRRAFEALVELCIDVEAPLLLLAGDLYDGNWRDYATGLFFVAQMRRLKENGVAVVMLRGNHDAESRLTKKLRLPDNVHDLSTSKPETRRFEQLGVAVHGQGFANAQIDEDLSLHYPEPVAGLLNIGLLHTGLEGRAAHARYAPTTADKLAAKGYGYWALGHVHEHEVVRQDPWIVWPGNLQGRHARETGPKGACVLTVDDGRIGRVQHVPLDVVRWVHVHVEAGDCQTGDEVVELVRAQIDDQAHEAGKRLLATRVTVAGASAAHDELTRDPVHWESQFRSAAMDLDGDVWLEKIRLRTETHVDRATLLARGDAITEILQSIAELAGDDPALQELAATLSPLSDKLPADAKRGDDGIDLTDLSTLRELLAEAEHLILPRLAAAAKQDEL
jgi:exonuclease SbcD